MIRRQLYAPTRTDGITILEARLHRQMCPKCLRIPIIREVVIQRERVTIIQT